MADISDKIPVHSSLEKECELAARSLEAFVVPQDFAPLMPALHSKEKEIYERLLSQESTAGLAVLQVIKVGLIGSARYGRGIVIARLSDGSTLSFYQQGFRKGCVSTFGFGFGFQAGFAATELLCILNRGAVEALSRGDSIVIGSSAGVAFGRRGRIGEGYLVAVELWQGDVKKAHMIAYSHASGLFGGFALEGGFIRQRRDDNKAHYGEDVTLRDILSGKVQPPYIELKYFYDILRRFESPSEPSNAEEKAKEAPEWKVIERPSRSIPIPSSHIAHRENLHAELDRLLTEPFDEQKRNEAIERIRSIPLSQLTPLPTEHSVAPSISSRTAKAKEEVFYPHERTEPISPISQHLKNPLSLATLLNEPEEMYLRAQQSSAPAQMEGGPERSEGDGGGMFEPSPKEKQIDKSARKAERANEALKDILDDVEKSAKVQIEAAATKIKEVASSTKETLLQAVGVVKEKVGLGTKGKDSSEETFVPLLPNPVAPTVEPTPAGTTVAVPTLAVREEPPVTLLPAEQGTITERLQRIDEDPGGFGMGFFRTEEETQIDSPTMARDDFAPSDDGESVGGEELEIPSVQVYINAHAFLAGASATKSRSEIIRCDPLEWRKAVLHLAQVRDIAAREQEAHHGLQRTDEDPSGSGSDISGTMHLEEKGPQKKRKRRGGKGKARSEKGKAEEGSELNPKVADAVISVEPAGPLLTQEDAKESTQEAFKIQGVSMGQSAEEEKDYNMPFMEKIEVSTEEEDIEDMHQDAPQTGEAQFRIPVLRSNLNLKQEIEEPLPFPYVPHESEREEGGPLLSTEEEFIPSASELQEGKEEVYLSPTYSAFAAPDEGLVERQYLYQDQPMISSFRPTSMSDSDFHREKLQRGSISYCEKQPPSFQTSLSPPRTYGTFGFDEESQEMERQRLPQHAVDVESLAEPLSQLGKLDEAVTDEVHQIAEALSLHSPWASRYPLVVFVESLHSEEGESRKKKPMNIASDLDDVTIEAKRSAFGEEALLQAPAPPSSPKTLGSKAEATSAPSMEAVAESLAEARRLSHEMAAKWIEGARMLLEQGKSEVDTSYAQWKTLIESKLDEASRTLEDNRSSLALKVREAENILLERPEQLKNLMAVKLGEAIELARAGKGDIDEVLDDIRTEAYFLQARIESVLRVKFEEANLVAVNRIEALRGAAEPAHPH